MRLKARTVTTSATPGKVMYHQAESKLPVASDRVILPGLNDPPCWVVPTGGVCIRGGWKPPPVVLIDLDQFPDALTAEEAAGVFAVAEDEE